MTKVKKISILLLFLLIHFFSFSQQKYGLPSVINYFDENESNRNEQVWDISQTKCGLLYFASNTHFVEFDGTKWNDFVKDIGSQFISLDIDTSTRTFYIGAQNNLLVSRLVNGQYETENLSVSGVISSTWKTYYSKGIAYFFINKKDIAIYENNKVELAQRPSNFEITRGFKVNDEIYAVSNNGIAIVKGNKTTILSTKREDVFREDIRTILNYDDSTLLLGTKKGSLYFFNPTTESYNKFTTEVDDYLHKSEIYNGAIIDSVTIALTTLKGGVVIINKKGKLINIINKESGLLSDAVYTVFVDDNKNLWLGTGMGVSFVNWHSSIRYFDQRNNIRDLLQAVTIFNDKLVVSSADGFFTGDLNQKPHTLVEPNEYQFLYGGNFLSFYIEGKKYLAVSEYEGISFFDENLKFKNNIDIYSARKISHSPIVNERYYVANFNELVTIDVSKLTKDNSISIEHHFLNLPTNIQNLTFDSDNNLWLCCNKDLLLLDFDNKESLNNYSRFTYNTYNGLPDCSILNVFEYDNKIFVSTNEGLYVLVNENIAKSEYKFIKYKGGIFNKLKESIVISTVSVKKLFFIQTQNAVYKINKTTNQIEELFFGDIFDFKFTDIHFIKNYIWTYSRDKVICINPTTFNDHIYSEKKFILRSVKIGDNPNFVIYNNDSIVRAKNSSYFILPKITQKNNSIAFTFAYPFNDNQDKIEYYFIIENKNKKWQKIESGNTLTLRELSAGKYSILVKAINFYGIESNIISIYFVVKPKLYLSPFAIISYFFLLIILFFLISYLRGKKIHKEKIKLEKTIFQRTEELEQQNEELELQSSLLTTQKKLLQKESRRLKLATIELKQLSLVASKTSNSVLILEKNGKIEWWNRGFTDLFSYNIDKYKNLPFRIAFKKIRADVLKEIRVYSEDKGIISFTKHEIFENNEEIWYQTTISPVFDEQNNLFKFVIIDVNISDIKLAEKQILEQKQLLKNKDENFTQSSANMMATKEQYKKTSLTNKENIFYAKFLCNFFTSNTINFNNKIKYFVLNKPFDKLSGDFIWEMDFKDKTFIAIGDATGHNVKGSILSVFAVNILEKIIVANENKTPAVILQKFNNKFTSIINSSDKIDDNIAIALISIDLKKSKLEFSGARIPLYYIKNDNLSSLYTFEADRTNIGKNNKKEFTHQFLSLNNKDRIYLITDGWINQFGKFGQQKYTTKKLKEFLKSMQKYNIEEQKELFNKEIIKWKGNFEQVDDILVFGAEIKL